MTMPAAGDELESALAGWGPAVRELVASFPRELIKWGIFDTADHPASTYARGRICIAGDAAHAATPFHGAGAGMGVEDALVLVTALDTALDCTNDGTHNAHAVKKAEAVVAAFRAYSEVRRPRTEWLVQSSRDMGDIYEWRYAATGRDPQKCKAEFERRSRRLWDFDIDKMVAEARSETERWLQMESNKQSAK
jgi:salicylate hydroxylase